MSDDDSSPVKIVRNFVEKRTPLQRQLLVSLGPCFLMLIVAFGVSFGAVALPQLKKKDSNISIDDEQASWIASLQFLVSCIACNFSGFLSAKYGRRKILLLSCIPLTIAWGVTFTSTNLEMLLFGCFLRGLANGTILPILGVYIGEISSATNRGALTATLQLFFESGILLGHLLGTFLSWKTTSLVCFLICCITTMIISAIPESPNWLLKKLKITEAKRAFFKCNGRSVEAKEQMVTLMEYHAKESTKGSSLGDLFKEISSKKFQKPLLTVVVYTLTMLFSGYDLICAYSIYYLEELFGGTVDSYAAMLSIDTLYIFASLLACLVSKMYKRRFLVLVNGFGTTFALFAMITVLELTKSSPIMEKLKTIALVAFLFAHTICIEFGQSLHSTVTSELFPFSTRSYGSSIIFTIRVCGAFVITKVGLTMLNTLGVIGVFAICGTVSLLGNLILALILPETKDKTLEEVEEYFSKN